MDASIIAVDRVNTLEDDDVSKFFGILVLTVPNRLASGGNSIADLWEYILTNFWQHKDNTCALLAGNDDSSSGGNDPLNCFFSFDGDAAEAGALDFGSFFLLSFKVIGEPKAADETVCPITVSMRKSNSSINSESRGMSTVDGKIIG